MGKKTYSGATENKPGKRIADRPTGDRACEPIPLADLLVAMMHPLLAVAFLDEHYRPGAVSPSLRRKALKLRKRLQALADAELFGDELE